MPFSRQICILLQGAGLLLGTASLTMAGNVKAKLNQDGAVSTTGIIQPGRSAQIPENCAASSGQVQVVVCAAEAFLSTLSADQKARVVLPLEKANSTAWSNLPCGSSCRVGIALADLNEEQVRAALAVIRAASSEYGNEGYDELTKIMMADDILNASQAADGNAPKGMPPVGAPPGGMMPNGMAPPPFGAGMTLSYASTAYMIAFLGTPSLQNTWQLQFGGHHLALLRTYKAGRAVGETPNFIGVEPKVWSDGKETFAPLEDDHAAMVAMLAGLTVDQQKAAKLETAFSDVLLGPGKDGQFPVKKQGLKAFELNATQKTLVLTAISRWVRDSAPESADEIMETYKSQLDETYIAFSGQADLGQHADYVRIDGPRVWIEFVCQNGVIYSNQIHYHTIWRDHQTDYGAVFSF